MSDDSIAKHESVYCLGIALSHDGEDIESVELDVVVRIHCRRKGQGAAQQEQGSLRERKTQSMVRMKRCLVDHVAGKAGSPRNQ